MTTKADVILARDNPAPRLVFMAIIVLRMAPSQLKSNFGITVEFGYLAHFAPRLSFGEAQRVFSAFNAAIV